MNRGFNPYQNNPVLESMFTGSGSYPLPASAQPAAQSVAAFSKWLKTTHPQLFAQIATTAPELLDPVNVVKSTLGNYEGDSGDVENGFDSIANAFSGAVEDITKPAVVSDWGNRILDFARGAIQLNAERQILEANIARAERNQAPISVPTNLTRPGAAGGVPNWVLYAGVGLAVFALLRR